MTTAKKLFIKTYGCQMNVYDSERMAETLGAEGYVATIVAGTPVYRDGEATRALPGRLVRGAKAA